MNASVTINPSAFDSVCNTVITTVSNWYDVACSWIKSAFAATVSTTKSAAAATTKFVVAAVVVAGRVVTYAAMGVVGGAAVLVIITHPIFTLLAVGLVLSALFTDENSVGALACLVAVALVFGWVFAAAITVAFELVLLIAVLMLAVVGAAAFGGIKPSYRM